MLPEIEKIKGVHPGAILKRELKILCIKGSELANIIQEHKQTISAVLNKRRAINPALSVKLAHFFKVAPDYFMLLQASYDVKELILKDQKQAPNLSHFRKSLFWDTSLHTIDWEQQKRAVIQRVLERGNEKEINEILTFYGRELISKELPFIKESRLPSFRKNIETYCL